jgi:hypothetical protein
MATNGNDKQEAKDGDVQLPTSVLGEQSLAADMARAEIDQAIATAHRYPRSLDIVIKKIETMACYNEAAAANCIYSLPRAGKAIIGPSIGFANIVAQAWGNCTDAARIVHIDRKEKMVSAEGGFHDLETNRKTIVPVQRRIVSKDGRIYNDDMIMVTGMAAASIARRNAILNAVPRALWFPIYEEALTIVRGDMQTFVETKDKSLKAFAQFGVAPDKVIKTLGLKGEADLTLEHIPILRGMYQALRDGTATVEEMFDPRRMTGGGFEVVANPLGEDEPKETIDKETGEILDSKMKAAKAENDKQLAAENQLAGKKPRGRPRKQTEAPSDKLAEQTEADANLGARVGLQEPQAAGHEGTGPAAAARPKNVPEYKAYLQSWLASSSTVAVVEDRWRQDRTLRGDCMVVEADFAAMLMLKTARVNELQAK